MSYETNLKSWGDTGSEYPDAYSYQDGIPPVDRWDNFLIHNIIEDINFLLEHTQSLDETDLNGENGEAGQVLVTDGTNANWESITAGSSISNDGVEVLEQPDNVDFGNELEALDNGDNTVTVNANFDSSNIIAEETLQVSQVVPEGETYVIEENKSMVVAEPYEINGDLEVNGTLKVI